MIQAKYIKHSLQFKKAAGTSRGVLHSKDSWYILLKDPVKNIQGIGECSLIPGLSIDPPDQMESKIMESCAALTEHQDTSALELEAFPALNFALETAQIDLESGGRRLLFESAFTEGKTGIPINGLIWMGNKKDMSSQVKSKLEQSFHILKLKVGAIDFEEELAILNEIRKDFKAGELEIRLDANGAWGAREALEKLKQLSELEIHSLEQPIKAGKWDEMAGLCELSPIPIALDEELIGVHDPHDIIALLDSIKPTYIILKPSLLGGLAASRRWIEEAERRSIDWWVTSALESNIGLNAIAQWTASLKPDRPQGLGTGSLFLNNISSPLKVVEDKLYYLPGKAWDLSAILKQI